MSIEALEGCGFQSDALTRGEPQEQSSRLQATCHHQHVPRVEAVADSRIRYSLTLRAIYIRITYWRAGMIRRWGELAAAKSSEELPDFQPSFGNLASRKPQAGALAEQSADDNNCNRKDTRPIMG